MSPLRLTVRVHPRTSRNRLHWDGDTLEVWTTEPPVEGRANAGVIKAVARWLDIAPVRIVIVSGHNAKTKIVEISGMVSLPEPQKEPEG